MALTPGGETGKTIQLMRTQKAYNNADVIAEQLEYGEPLYNDNDKTLLIGDAAGTANNNLKVIKQLDRNKANAEIFTAASGSDTRNSTSGLANLYNESNASVYPIDKQWPVVQINLTNTTYSLSTTASDLCGDAQSTAFSSVPCVQKYSVAGMLSTYRPIVSLYLLNSSLSNQTTVKNLTKSFSCISRVETTDGYISIVFNKKPVLNFYIQLTGG